MERARPEGGCLGEIWRTRSRGGARWEGDGEGGELAVRIYSDQLSFGLARLRTSVYRSGSDSEVRSSRIRVGDGLTPDGVRVFRFFASSVCCRIRRRTVAAKWAQFHKVKVCFKARTRKRSPKVTSSFRSHNFKPGSPKSISHPSKLSLLFGRYGHLLLKFIVQWHTSNGQNVLFVR